MSSAKLLRKFVVTAGIALSGAVVVGSSQSAAASEDNACPVSDVDYNVVANIVIKDTPFGAADGTFPLGEGKVRLRFENGAAKMMSYETNNHLTVEAKVAMLSTKVVTDSHTSTSRDACDGSAQGTLHNGTLTWNSHVSGYHSDGTMVCSGSMCGKFGAPPKGPSPLHDAPSSALTFSPFTFSADGSTFTMPYTLVSKSDSPKQTTYLALSGRRVKQTCAADVVASCGGRLASN